MIFFCYLNLEFTWKMSFKILWINIFSEESHHDYPHQFSRPDRRMGRFRQVFKRTIGRSRTQMVKYVFSLKCKKKEVIRITQLI